ncbi:MAG: DinB family protein [Chloroflexi bacterium]|nr:DinB family protein [Chloroflexota bacterium]
MDKDARATRPAGGPEREMLAAFLNFQRDTLLWKVAGLSEEQARRIWTPSGTSLLGLVKHLGYVERSWFQRTFAGQDVYIPWRAGDPDADFRIEPDDSLERVTAFYHAEVARSREITAAATSLDDVARDPGRPHSLRRILIHMIEETARHNGHADILREVTDGAIGE